MKTPTLAPVYLDNVPVSLMGDPKPQVSKVIAATGKHPEKYDIMLLETETDTPGEPLPLDFVIDRTEEPTKAIYLTSVEKEADEDSVVAGGSTSTIRMGGNTTGFGVSSGTSTSIRGADSGSSKASSGGSAQGNQGFGSGSARPENQGTSTQDQGGFGQASQGNQSGRTFGQDSGLQQSGKTGGQPLKGGVGTSSQTHKGTTQNLGARPTNPDKPEASEGEAGDEWPVQGKTTGDSNSSGTELTDDE